MREQFVATMEKLELIENQLICDAYRNGRSVITILRTLSMCDGDKICRVLRHYGLIRKIDQRPKYEIHPKIEGTLNMLNHSFLKWCNCRRFEALPAARALNKLPEKGDCFGQRVHDALRSDFVHLYEEIYLGAEPVARYADDYDLSRRSRHDLHIEWDDTLECYKAFLPMHPSIYAYGDRWDDSLMNLKQIFNMRRRIHNLEHLIEHGPAWRK